MSRKSMFLETGMTEGYNETEGQVWAVKQTCKVYPSPSSFHRTVFLYREFLHEMILGL